MSEKILRPGSQPPIQYAEDLPKRPEPKPETAENLPHEWVSYYDSLSANEAAVLYKHNSDFARRTDILLERRKKNGF
jgi:hypothetical protein